jgi:hypothetical protein
MRKFLGLVGLGILLVGLPVQVMVSEVGWAQTVSDRNAESIKLLPSQCKIRQVTKEKNGSTRKTEK